jgi:hypothetical protein
MGAPRLEAPADFAEVAATHSEDEICARYQFSVRPVRRMLRDQPKDWQRERKSYLAKRSGASCYANLRFQTAKPCPVDFCTVAADQTQAAIALYYQVSGHTVSNWVKQQPAEWQAEFRANAKRIRTEIAKQHIAAARSKFHANAEKRRLERLARLAPKPPRKSCAPPVPDGLFADLAAMSGRLVAAKHSVTVGVVDGWKKRLTPEERDRLKEIFSERRRIDGLSRIRAASAANVAKSKERQAAKRAAKPAKAKTPGKRSGVNWGFSKPTEIAPMSGGVAAMAAQHLRRFYAPVVRGDVLNEELTGYYKVGREILPEAEMVERARAKGWDADAWRRVA